MKTVGERIRYLRTKHKLSMAALAQQTGSTSGTVALWENNKRLPGARNIVSLAAFFKVSTDWLLK